MKKTVLVTAIGVALATTSMSGQAALVAGTLLAMDPGVSKCIGSNNNGEVFPDCSIGTTIGSGSYFAMAGGRVALQPGLDGGIIMGVTQPGTGAHGGPPTGTENAPIDAAWLFFCNTGFHFTTSPITVIDNDVNNDGGFTQTLDLSGWSVAWSGIPEIPLPGVATISCSLADCAAGSSYAMDFGTPIPPSTLHNFGGVRYDLHLEGTVVIPVPAAVWLFGSGLLGLVGIARRKQFS